MNTGHPVSDRHPSGVNTRTRHLLRLKSSSFPTGRGSEDPGIFSVSRIEGSHGNSCTCGRCARCSLWNVAYSGSRRGTIVGWRTTGLAMVLTTLGLSCGAKEPSNRAQVKLAYFTLRLVTGQRANVPNQAISKIGCVGARSDRISSRGISPYQALFNHLEKSKRCRCHRRCIHHRRERPFISLVIHKSRPWLPNSSGSTSRS